MDGNAIERFCKIIDDGDRDRNYTRSELYGFDDGEKLTIQHSKADCFIEFEFSMYDKGMDLAFGEKASILEYNAYTTLIRIGENTLVYLTDHFKFANVEYPIFFCGVYGDDDEWDCFWIKLDMVKFFKHYKVRKQNVTMVTNENINDFDTEWYTYYPIEITTKIFGYKFTYDFNTDSLDTARKEAFGVTASSHLYQFFKSVILVNGVFIWHIGVEREKYPVYLCKEVNKENNDFRLFLLRHTELCDSGHNAQCMRKFLATPKQFEQPSDEKMDWDDGRFAGQGMFLDQNESPQTAEEEIIKLTHAWDNLHMYAGFLHDRHGIQPDSITENLKEWLGSARFQIMELPGDT